MRGDDGFGIKKTAFNDGVSAEGDHGIRTNPGMNFFFISMNQRPVAFGNRSDVSGYAQSLVALTENLFRIGLGIVQSLSFIKNTVRKIPIFRGKNLNCFLCLSLSLEKFLRGMRS